MTQTTQTPKEKTNNIGRICNTLYWIVFFISLTLIFIYTIGYMREASYIKTGIENLDKISLLTQDYQVNWLYSCPDYVSNYYNCPEQQKFMNMSGKYCNNILVCENKFEILNKTK